MGVGFAVSFKQYMSPLIVCWTHLPTRKGMVSGIIIAGFGFGASIFDQIATAIVNPDNKSPDIKVKHGDVTDKFFDDEIANRVPEMLRWLCLCYACLVAVGLFLLGPMPPVKNI